MVNTQDFQDFKSMKSVEHCAAVAQKCCRAIFICIFIFINFQIVKQLDTVYFLDPVIDL